VLIDAHTHSFAPEMVARRAAICDRDATFAELYADPKAKIATVADLLAALDDAGVARAVVAGFAFAHERDLAAQNEYLLAQAHDCSRLIPIATVNPAIARWREAARRALATGAQGFGELRPHNQGWDPVGIEGRALCELAAEAGAVLLWHVSEPVGHLYPGKRGGIGAGELAALAATYPGVRMIAAHLGAGLSFFLHMPEVREAIQNVYFDTAASGLLYDDESVAQLVAVAGRGRVLFGSDYPLLSPRRQLQRLQALLPGDIAKAVCGANADTLFSD
jgi:uncharacterized protein